MIDRRELLEKAREKKLNLMIVEKDYVLGWLLYGFSGEPNLVFKGGTALSKIYFPRIWRLSEDLDFSIIEGAPESILERVERILAAAQESSGIRFSLRSSYANPEYLQLKIRYEGVIGKNWIKADVTKNDLVDKPVLKPIHRDYSDYIQFKIKVESLEEIFASKLRAVIERKKCRDYFDLWKLTKMRFDGKKIKRIFLAKCALKNIEFEGKDQIFPPDLLETLKPYWERELGRLINPTPDIEEVLKELKKALEFI